MFTEKFNKLLEERNMTVKQLSMETGIPITTIYEWVNGRVEPSLKYVRTLNKYFKLDSGYFLE